MKYLNHPIFRLAVANDVLGFYVDFLSQYYIHIKKSKLKIKSDFRNAYMDVISRAGAVVYLVEKRINNSLDKLEEEGIILRTPDKIKMYEELKKELISKMLENWVVLDFVKIGDLFIESPVSEQVSGLNELLRRASHFPIYPEFERVVTEDLEYFFGLLHALSTPIGLLFCFSLKIAIFCEKMAKSMKHDEDKVALFNESKIDYERILTVSFEELLRSKMEGLFRAIPFFSARIISEIRQKVLDINAEIGEEFAQFLSLTIDDIVKSDVSW